MLVGTWHCLPVLGMAAIYIVLFYKHQKQTRIIIYGIHIMTLFALISCVWVLCSLPLLPAQYIAQMFTKINVAVQNLLYMCKNVHLTSVANIKVLLMCLIQNDHPGQANAHNPIEQKEQYVQLYDMTLVCTRLFHCTHSCICNCLNFR